MIFSGIGVAGRVFGPAPFRLRKAHRIAPLPTLRSRAPQGNFIPFAALALLMAKRIKTIGISQKETALGIIWTIIIGFVAGVIAKLIMPGNNEPQGFILTTLLGVIGAFVASFLGQSMGWYGENDPVGLIGAVIGAIIVLMIYGFLRRRA